MLAKVWSSVHVSPDSVHVSLDSAKGYLVGLPWQCELLEKPIVSVDFARESLVRALLELAELCRSTQELSKRAVVRSRTEKIILGPDNSILA